MRRRRRRSARARRVASARGAPATASVGSLPPPSLDRVPRRPPSGADTTVARSLVASPGGPGSGVECRAPAETGCASPIRPSVAKYARPRRWARSARQRWGPPSAMSSPHRRQDRRPCGLSLRPLPLPLLIGHLAARVRAPSADHGPVHDASLEWDTAVPAQVGGRRVGLDRARLNGPRGGGPGGHAAPHVRTHHRERPHGHRATSLGLTPRRVALARCGVAVPPCCAQCCAHAQTCCVQCCAHVRHPLREDSATRNTPFRCCGVAFPTGLRCQVIRGLLSDSKCHLWS
jgi:hypothetical protein